MKPEMRMTLGLGAGYLLGRTRKMRWAWMLAAAGATGGLGSAGQLIRRQAGSLAASSAISKVAGDVPGRLVEAGKAAAVAAATGKMDSLVDRLHGQTEALRRPHMPGGGSEDEDGGPDTRRRRPAPERPSDEDLYDEPEDEQGQDEDEPAARRRAAPGNRRRRPAARSADEEEFDEEDEDLDDGEADDDSSRAAARADRGGDRRASEGGSRRPETRGTDDERRPERHGPRARSSSERSEAPIRRTRR
jgi:hypothetical protein